ncbi:meiotic recombination protein REC114 isoform X3 [Xiphophorus couchianus]|uniref:meiotic recombination protein REC114 isoform X3 n=1 Tax=Xiphophorus couchianus TaxID=32473 RepID=UPI0010167D24|nr:meiotic recombination protein REC114 isoform X3 [Xiphophorus couchianus]
MAASNIWTLRRFGHFVPQTERKPWKVSEAKANEPKIVMTLLESGYLLVLQGQESLATVPLHDGSNSLKVQHKSDNLMIRFTVKGESRMIRMQFDGSSTAEAVNQCSRAVEKLLAYVPVTSLEVAATHPNQPPVEVPPAAQQACQRKTGQPEPEAVHGSVSIKRLTEHYLGETTLALPNIYSPCSLASGDLEPILRVCLLDPSFPAFVEKVQEELEKLQEE